VIFSGIFEDSVLKKLAMKFVIESKAKSLVTILHERDSLEVGVPSRKDFPHHDSNNPELPKL